MTAPASLPMFDLTLVTGNTKAAVKAAGGGSSDLWTVPPSALHYDPRDNVRPVNEARVRRIANLIHANGYDRKKPIGCFVRKVAGEDRIQVYEGQHRYLGAMLAIEEGAQIDRLPIIIDEAKTVSRAKLIYDGINGNDSEKLTPLELAEKVKELRDLGEEDPAIASRLDVTAQTLRDLTVLIEAPATIHKMIREGKVASTLAIEQIREHGAKKAADQLKQAISTATAAGKGKVTKKHLGTAKKPSNPTPTKLTEANAKQLLQALQAVLHDDGFGKLFARTRDAVHTALEPLSDLLDAKPMRREWPISSCNEHGCYEPVDSIVLPKKGSSLTLAVIHLAQVKQGAWIFATEGNIGSGQFSGPCTLPRDNGVYWTRAQAIGAAIVDLTRHITGPSPGYSVEREKKDRATVRAWLDGLLTDVDPDWTAGIEAAFQAGREPDVERPERCAAQKKDRPKPGLDPACAWPFPRTAQ